MKKINFVIVVLAIVACTPTKTVTTPKEEPSYLETFLEIEYDGIVWGDFVGKITDKGFEFGDLVISAEATDKTVTIKGKTEGNSFNGKIEEEALSFQLHESGSAYGKTENDKPFYIISGEILHTDLVEKRLQEKKLLASSLAYAEQEGIIANTIQQVFWQETPDGTLIELALVIDDNKELPLIRFFKIIKQESGDWAIKEIKNKG